MDLLARAADERCHDPGAPRQLRLTDGMADEPFLRPPPLALEPLSVCLHTLVSKVLVRIMLGARVVILFAAALVGFGLAAFRPNISLAERGWDALVGCFVLFHAVRAERQRRSIRQGSSPG
jgi:hypothetical protein